MAEDMFLSTKDILKKYINFYKNRGHKQIPNVSLVPQNDSTLLFVNSGMFPLVPYLMGESHPMGNRLVNVQRCIRFEDIEEVGDNRHTTAFHMLGNWSLNDYFKKEQLNWVYEFLCDELDLDIKRLYPTVFEGSEFAPKDETSIEILKEVFSSRGVSLGEGTNLFSYLENWWMRGDAVGELGGPDSEVFYYMGGNTENYGLGQDPEENEDIFIEIGNSVFMQYVRTAEGWRQIDRQNVDFGGGLERLALAIQEKNDIFETDNFWPIIERIEELTSLDYQENPELTRHMRIVADHIRSSVFLAMDGVTPSNKDQGYVLRRLLRRIVRSGKSLGLEKDISVKLVAVVVNLFSWMYPQLTDQKPKIEKIFQKEEDKFRRTLKKASKEVDKFLGGLEFPVTEEELAKKAFMFYQSLGYPEEVFLEDLRDEGIKVDASDFNDRFKELERKHKEKSRKGAKKKFEGGLAGKDETTIKYHTATHLLHASLRDVLGEEVIQEGSNITSERLRFDFSFGRKLTEGEVIAVQGLVNKKIKEGLPVKFEIMSKEEAVKTGAIHAFDDDYGEQVKVYYTGKDLDSAFSKEFCGGPHVEDTAELDLIRIYKQKKTGRKTIRVYARFEDL